MPQQLNFILFHMQVRRVRRENRGSRAMWLCTMQISVNMAFHLLLMHCYTATHWKETVTTGKTDDPLAYFSICIGSIASAETSAKMNPLRGRCRGFSSHRQEWSWMLTKTCPTGCSIASSSVFFSVFFSCLRHGHIPATGRVFCLGSSTASF